MEDHNKQSIEVYQSFFSVTRHLSRLAQQSAADLGLTVNQIIILDSVRTKPGLTQKEVTERLVFAKSRVSLYIDSLVEKGLVIRKVSEQDRRETELNLTPEGEEICRQYNREAGSYKALQEALAHLSPEEIESLRQLHSRLLSHLK